MTLDQLRPYLGKIIDPVSEYIGKLGITPNQISFTALIISLIAGVIFVFIENNTLLGIIGAALVITSGFLDVLDGAVARKLNLASKRGDFLDHVFDRYADIFIIGGLAIGVEQYLLGLLAISGVLMTSYLGTQGQAIGLERVYGGLIGRADRIVLIAVFSAAYGITQATFYNLTSVGLILVILAIIGHITALQRFYNINQQLKKSD